MKGTPAPFISVVPALTGLLNELFRVGPGWWGVGNELEGSVSAWGTAPLDQSQRPVQCQYSPEVLEPSTHWFLGTSLMRGKMGERTSQPNWIKVWATPLSFGGP